MTRRRRSGLSGRQNALRPKTDFANKFSRLRRPSPESQKLHFSFSEKYDCLRASRLLLEGRIAIVTDVGSGMRWTRGCSVRFGAPAKAASRTAKTCGPDPPMLPRCWGQACWMISKRRWLSKPGHRGERVISRRAIAQGMPVDLAKPVVTAACFFCCRRAMGEAITRHFLRPLIS